MGTLGKLWTSLEPQGKEKFITKAATIKVDYDTSVAAHLATKVPPSSSSSSSIPTLSTPAAVKSPTKAKKTVVTTVESPTLGVISAAPVPVVIAAPVAAAPPVADVTPTLINGEKEHKKKRKRKFIEPSASEAAAPVIFAPAVTVATENAVPAPESEKKKEKV